MTHTIEITVQDEQLPTVLKILETLKTQGIRYQIDPDEAQQAYYESISDTLTEWSSEEDERAFENL